MVCCCCVLIFAVALGSLAVWYFLKKRRNAASNCFDRMVCSGTPKVLPLTEREKHDILRQQFRASSVAGEWDVIVIGSGLSGLTTAKFLAAAGKKVLVLEQHDRAGGACHNFDLDRFEFDVGVHYVQGMCYGPKNPQYLISLAATDSELQWQKLDDPFDVILIGAKSYGVSFGDIKDFFEQAKKWFPDEAENIDAYFNYVQKCLKELPWMFLAKYLPVLLVRFLFKTGIFGLLSKVFKHSSRTLLEVMEQFHFSKDLQIVVSYYCLNYGAPPNRASFLQHSMFYMGNGYYPVGGANSIVAPIVRSIEKLGGKVLVKADVQQISFENGRVDGVLVKDGKGAIFVRAPMVISTAPMTHTFRDLIPRDLAEKTAIYKAIQSLNKAEGPKIAGFQAYIGFDGSQADLKLPARNYCLYKTNDVLELDKYAMLSLEEAIDYGCPPMVFICFPSAKDPIWDERHPGTSTCQIITFANPAWFEEFKDSAKRKSLKRHEKEKYEDLKHVLGAFMIDTFVKHFPQLESRMVFTEFSTPLTQQYYMQNAYGELYSLTQQVERFTPAFWTELRCKTELPGLILSGQDVLYCGVSSAFYNGLLTASLVLTGNAFALQGQLEEAYVTQKAAEDAEKEKKTE